MLMRILLGLLASVLVVVVVLAVWFSSWLQQPLSVPKQGLIFPLESGSSVGHLAYGLNRAGAMQYPRLFLLYARVSGKTSVKIGEYKIAEGATPQSLLEQVNNGEVVSYRLTLVEGWSYRQALEYLHTQPKLKRQLKLGDWSQNDAILATGLPHPEGWFFPDTYQYVAGASDADILRRAHTAMKEVLAEEWGQKAEHLPYKDSYQALIMASIVERETGAPSERAQIAGVFVRRLDIGMRLQTDPTVIYGMGERYKGNIRRADLREKTTYNTYVIRGLPPTPIALPGREAIHAALHPDDGDTLYFVARGDGSHQFSADLDSHNRAVREYQFRRRSDYRSAPAP